MWSYEFLRWLSMFRRKISFHSKDGEKYHLRLNMKFICKNITGGDSGVTTCYLNAFIQNSVTEN